MKEERKMSVVLFPLKLMTTILLFILKMVFSLLSFLAVAISLPFVMVADLLGTLLSLITTLGVLAMIICWCSGNIDGKTLLVVSFIMGILIALLFAAESIAEYISDRFNDVTFFIEGLIDNIWL